MVASVGFTRPPGTAAFSRGAGLLALVLMLLSGASQVAATPIMQYNDTNTKPHMCYATVFMPLTDYTMPLIDYELTDTEPTGTEPTDAVSVQEPRLIMESGAECGGRGEASRRSRQS